MRSESDHSLRIAKVPGYIAEKRDSFSFVGSKDLDIANPAYRWEE
jgi:hypothetical protein